MPAPPMCCLMVLLTNISLNKIADGKHSCLFDPFVIYKEIKLSNIETKGLY